MFTQFFLLITSLSTIFCSSAIAQNNGSRIVEFGTTLQPLEQREASRQLAQSIADSNPQNWRAKGDQKRQYFFKEANTTVPYRLYVPSSWNGDSALPLVMFLHGAGANENTYVDQNNKQMITLAEEHGFLLLSPLGQGGAYGTIIRLPAVFGEQEEADKMIAARTPEIEQTAQISEKDVINVLEIILNEYPINPNGMFLTGHSMGSGGTWYLGGKYHFYWKAIAPMSGPFVQQEGYPWENLNNMPLFITEGTIGTPSLTGSRELFDWLKNKNYNVQYKEVEADHGGMVPLVLPDVFRFFSENLEPASVDIQSHITDSHFKKIQIAKRPQGWEISFANHPKISDLFSLQIFDLRGTKKFSIDRLSSGSSFFLPRFHLPAGKYQLRLKSDSRQINFNLELVP